MSFSHSIVFINQSKGNTMSLINTQVQPFKANAFHNGKFIEVTEASLKGKWNVFIFMPAAFTFNCPTEIEDAASPPTPISHTRCGTRLRLLWAKPSSLWLATLHTN
jgi:AhpC/TSA family